MAETFTESTWQEYRRIWILAERTCPVTYTDTLEEYIGGGYLPSEGLILIKRPELAGRLAPEPDSDGRMVLDACVILHELSHAISHQVGGPVYEEYIKALRFWNFVNMDGTLLNDKERKLIMDEETRVDLNGMTMAMEYSADLRLRYTLSMAENLSSYSSLLWTGYWPNGTRQRWEGSEIFKKVMSAIEKRDDGEQWKRKLWAGSTY